ncbi:hypothetical protein [Ekhidna sp.]
MRKILLTIFVSICLIQFSLACGGPTLEGPNAIVLNSYQSGFETATFSINTSSVPPQFDQYYVEWEPFLGVSSTGTDGRSITYRTNDYPYTNPDPDRGYNLVIQATVFWIDSNGQVFDTNTLSRTILIDHSRDPR